MGLFKESMEELFTMSSKLSSNRLKIIALKSDVENDDEDKYLESKYEVVSDNSNFKYHLNSEEAYVINKDLEEYFHQENLSHEKIAFFLTSELIDEDVSLEDNDDEDVEEEEEIKDYIRVTYLKQEDVNKEKIEISKDYKEKIDNLFKIYKHSFMVCLVINNEEDKIYKIIKELDILEGIRIINYEEILKERDFAPFVSNSMKLKKIVYKAAVSFALGLTLASFLLINFSQELLILMEESTKGKSIKNKLRNKNNALNPKIQKLNEYTTFEVKTKDIDFNYNISRKY